MARLSVTGKSCEHRGTNCGSYPSALTPRADVDVLRQMVQFMAQRLMELDVEARCGAGYDEKPPERLNSRNGYRERTWDTRASSVELNIPKLRQGSDFPEFLATGARAGPGGRPELHDLRRRGGRGAPSRPTSVATGSCAMPRRGIFKVRVARREAPVAPVPAWPRRAATELQFLRQAHSARMQSRVQRPPNSAGVRPGWRPRT